LLALVTGFFPCGFAISAIEIKSINYLGGGNKNYYDHQDAHYDVTVALQLEWP
jgi:hypothetical protein